MIGVYQTIFAPPDGDCWRACVASILGLPIADVPNIGGLGYSDPWYDDWQAWMKGRNLALLSFPVHEDGWKPDGYAILGSRLPNDWRHATVTLDGVPVWNPMPGYGERIGDIGTWEFWTVFAVLDPAKTITINAAVAVLA